MATSRNRPLIAILVAAVVGLSIALFVVTRPQPRVEDAPAPERPKPVDPRRDSAFAPSRPPNLGQDRPPARRFNDLGQPLDEDGRPIGPPTKLAKLRNRGIAEGELPMTPPRFDDPARREKFKKWWVDEFARRVAVFEKLEPKEGYPGAEETAKLLGELYDASEPRAPDEPIERAMERRRNWRGLLGHFLDTYGVPPYTIVTRGGDPQHGAPAPPPFQPPGSETGPVEPAEPATEAPPGREPGTPAGEAPLDRSGDPAGRDPETDDAPNP